MILVSVPILKIKKKDITLEIFFGFVAVWIISMLVGKKMWPEPYGTIFGIFIGIAGSIVFGIGVFIGGDGKVDVVEPQCIVYSVSTTGERIEHTVACESLKK